MIPGIIISGAVIAGLLGLAVVSVMKYFGRGGKLRFNTDGMGETRPGLYYLDCTGDTSKPPGPFSPEGVLLYPLKGGQFIRHPIAIAQYALGAHDRSLVEAREMWREKFLIHAEWFVESCERVEDGMIWRIPHHNAFYGLESDYCSALAQGQAISVLVRAFRVTGDTRFLQVASNALNPFAREVGEDSGLRRTFEEGAWFEEYPSNPPSFVLNGFLFTLLGLSELAGHDRRAADFFEEGVKGLLCMLDRFDTGYWTRYDLFPGNERPAAPFYHRLHIGLVRALRNELRAAGLPGSMMMDTTASRWESYWDSTLCRSRAFSGVLLNKPRELFTYGIREKI